MKHRNNMHPAKMNTLRLDKMHALGDYMTLIFLGFFDKILCDDDNIQYNNNNNIARVETTILKISHNKLSLRSPVCLQVTINTTDISVNPMETNDSIKVPAISIPSELFKSKNQSYILLLSVETSPKIKTTIEDDEPSSKCPKTSTKRYGSELVIFDKNNRCLLTEGEYELALQEIVTVSQYRSQKKHATWEFITDENLKIFSKAGNPFETFNKCPTLKFILKWSKEPSPMYVDRPKLNIKQNADVDESDNSNVIISSDDGFNCNNNSICPILNDIKGQNPNLSEFLELDENENVNQNQNQNPYISGHNRHYYHTQTCLLAHPKELDIDSDDEIDPLWLQHKTMQMIDEFTDVNDGEKEFMKMWNLHLIKYGYFGDCQVPIACDTFIAMKGRELLQKNLYRNFILHLSTLFDYGVVSSEFVYKTTQKLQCILSTYSEGRKIMSESREAQIDYWSKVAIHKQTLQEEKQKHTETKTAAAAAEYINAGNSGGGVDQISSLKTKPNLISKENSQTKKSKGNRLANRVLRSSGRTTAVSITTTTTTSPSCCRSSQSSHPPTNLRNRRKPLAVLSGEITGGDGGDGVGGNKNIHRASGFGTHTTMSKRLSRPLDKVDKN